MRSPNPMGTPLILFAVAWAWRVISLWWHPSTVEADAEVYLSLASILAKSGDWADLATSAIAPVYPLALAGIMKLLRATAWNVLWIQAAFGAATCVIIWALARRIWDDATARLAFWLVCFYPVGVAAGKLFQPETLFVFWVAAIAYLGLRYVEEGWMRLWVAVSALCGMAALTKPGFGLFLPVAWLAIGFERRGFRRRWFWEGCVAAVVFLAVIAPWTIQNYKTYGQLVLITPISGRSVYGSLHPDQGKYMGRFIADPVAIEIEHSGLNEAQKNRRYLAAAARDILHTPVMQTVKLLALKMIFFWLPFDWELVRPEGIAVYNFWYAFALPFAVLGAVLIWKTHRAAARWLAAFVLYAATMCLVVFGLPRYRLPLDYLIMMWAAAGILWLMRKSQRPMLTGGLVLFYFCLQAWAGANTPWIKSAVRGTAQAVGLW